MSLYTTINSPIGELLLAGDGRSLQRLSMQAAPRPIRIDPSWLLIFGSVVSSGLPILMAPVSVTMALATIYFIGHRVDMSIFVLNTASMLGR